MCCLAKIQNGRAIPMIVASLLFLSGAPAKAAAAHGMTAAAQSQSAAPAGDDLRSPSTHETRQCMRRDTFNDIYYAPC